jgi:hemoglobin
VHADEITDATKAAGQGSEQAATDNAPPAASYYERIGGAPTIRVAVERFYQRILDDAELAPYFAEIDMPRLKRHQVQLLSTVLGGPNEYAGRDLAVAHGGRGITDRHYAKVADHLATTLRDLGAPSDVITAVAETLDGVRPQIVQAGPEAAGSAHGSGPEVR